MGERSSFTSLMAMVESHLSKTSVGERPNEQRSHGVAAPSFSLPNICSVRNTDSEQFLLPPPSTIIQLPRFEVKNSEITEILAHQVKNMLVAKENALNEEKEKLSDRLQSINLNNEDDDYVIDLSGSIMRPDLAEHHLVQEVVHPVLSVASSMESLIFEENTEMSKELPKVVEEPLPMCDDMSDILYKRVKRGKCSVFGRVLGSRLRAVAAPYLHVRVLNPAIVPFDFSTPSPCDVNKQRRMHPPQDMYSHMNMVDRFMAITKDEL